MFDDSIARNLNRLRIIDQNYDFRSEDLPERIRWRLFLARQLAILRAKAV